MAKKLSPAMERAVRELRAGERLEVGTQVATATAAALVRRGLAVEFRDGGWGDDETHAAIEAAPSTE